MRSRGPCGPCTSWLDDVREGGGEGAGAGGLSSGAADGGAAGQNGARPVETRAFDPGRDELMLLQWTADERYYYR